MLPVKTNSSSEASILVGKSKQTIQLLLFGEYKEEKIINSLLFSAINKPTNPHCDSHVAAYGELMIKSREPSLLASTVLRCHPRLQYFILCLHIQLF